MGNDIYIEEVVDTTEEKKGDLSVSITNNKTFRLNLDSIGYQTKPTKEFGAIRNRLSNASQNLTMNEFIKAIENGQSFNPAELKGQTNDDFVSQQLFGVDIDNSYIKDGIEPLTIEKAIEICNEECVSIANIYYSFSHTLEIPKYRILFISDEVITDFEKAENLRKALISLFQIAPYMLNDAQGQVDGACKDASRVFFGTNKGFYKGKEFQENIRFNSDFLLARYYCSQPIREILEPELDTIFKDVTKKDNSRTNINIEQENKNFDLLSYVRNNHNIDTEKPQGKMVKINPCPICGHNDDFYIYPDTNTFCCYSSNNPIGEMLVGNINTFIRYTRNLDVKQAREYILYDLLGYERQSYNSNNQKNYQQNDEQEFIPNFNVICADNLMKKDFPQLQYAIDEILPQGIFFLSAPPKIGKSWLMLDMCISVATGTPFWNYNVTQGKALYLALEDNQSRIQRRLDFVSDDVKFSNNLKFVTGFDGEAKGLADGVVNQILNFLSETPDTRLIVIDTLGMIRNTDNNKKQLYNADVDDIKMLREITNNYNVSLILVHHNRKNNNYTTDVMEKISGTQGLAGTTDGNWVLDKPNRFDDEANLYIDNRDTPQFAFKLEFDPSYCKWDFIEHIQECEYTKVQTELGSLISDFLYNNENNFKGTAKELCESLDKFDNNFTKMQIKNLTISKHIIKIESLLKEKYNIIYRQERTTKARLIILELADQDELMVEPIQELTKDGSLTVDELLTSNGIAYGDDFCYSSDGTIFNLEQ